MKTNKPKTLVKTDKKTTKQVQLQVNLWKL